MVELAQQTKARGHVVVIWKRRRTHATLDDKQWVDARIAARLERVVREAAVPLGANLLAPAVQPSAGPAPAAPTHAEALSEHQPKKPGTALLVLSKTEPAPAGSDASPAAVPEPVLPPRQSETQAQRAGLGELLVTP